MLIEQMAERSKQSDFTATARAGGDGPIPGLQQELQDTSETHQLAMQKQATQVVTNFRGVYELDNDYQLSMNDTMKNKKAVDDMKIAEAQRLPDLEHQATVKRPKVQTKDPFTTDELKSIYEYEHSSTALPKKLEGKENGILTQGELVYVNDSSLLTNKTGGAEGLIEVNESIPNQVLLDTK